MSGPSKSALALMIADKMLEKAGAAPRETREVLARSSLESFLKAVDDGSATAHERARGYFGCLKSRELLVRALFAAQLEAPTTAEDAIVGRCLAMADACGRAYTFAHAAASDGAPAKTPDGTDWADAVVAIFTAVVNETSESIKLHTSALPYAARHAAFTRLSAELNRAWRAEIHPRPLLARVVVEADICAATDAVERIALLLGAAGAHIPSAKAAAVIGGAAAGGAGGPPPAADAKKAVPYEHEKALIRFGRPMLGDAHDYMRSAFSLPLFPSGELKALESELRLLSASLESNYLHLVGCEQFDAALAATPVSLDGCWAAVDSFVASLHAAAGADGQGIDVEAEARANAQIGVVFSDVLFPKSGRATSYFERAVYLCETCKPKLFTSRTWFQKAHAGLMTEDAKKKDAEAKARRAVIDGFLKTDAAKALVAAINAEVGKGAKQLLTHVYTTHAPPGKEAQPVVTAAKSLKQCVADAIVHYALGAGEAVTTLERALHHFIVERLNDFYAVMKDGEPPAAEGANASAKAEGGKDDDGAADEDPPDLKTLLKTDAQALAIAAEAAKGNAESFLAFIYKEHPQEGKALPGGDKKILERLKQAAKDYKKLALPTVLAEARLSKIVEHLNGFVAKLEEDV